MEETEKNKNLRKEKNYDFAVFFDAPKILRAETKNVKGQGHCFSYSIGFRFVVTSSIKIYDVMMMEMNLDPSHKSQLC